MISLREFVEYADILTGTDDRTFVLSDEHDKINIHFKYKKEEIQTSISYKDIKYEPGADQWTSEIKSATYKDIKYIISADYTETGRYGISTINAQVWVKRKDDVIDKLTPEIGIVSFASPVMGNEFDQLI